VLSFSFVFSGSFGGSRLESFAVFLYWHISVPGTCGLTLSTHSHLWPLAMTDLAHQYAYGVTAIIVTHGLFYLLLLVKKMSNSFLPFTWYFFVFFLSNGTTASSLYLEGFPVAKIPED